MAGIVTDLFGEDAYFSDADLFWTRQNEAIEARRLALIEEGWADVVIVPPGEHFHAWEHEKAAKRKGGRVYVDLRANGEAVFHEGYVTRKEARRIEKGETLTPGAKPARAEVTSTLGSYIDLHRHAAVRAAMLGTPGLALRLMVAHAAIGSPLWTVKAEPQTTRSDEVDISVADSKGEAQFDMARLKVLRLLGLSEEQPRVTANRADPVHLVSLFLRLVELGDDDVMAVLAIVMGESLAAGSPVVDALGQEIGLDMAAYWQADDTLFELLRDREVLVALVGEVAGPRVAEANAKEKGKTLKAIVRAHLAGADGRDKVEGWVPKWMAFPPDAYTPRGGVGSVAAHRLVTAAREQLAEDAAGEGTEGDAEAQGQGPDLSPPEEVPPLAA